MAEVKRPKLISFGCERINDKNTKQISKTVRISVVLTDSTEDNFPEFNYQDELAAVKNKSLKKSPVRQTNGGLDPYNEDDEDVKRIAAQMEEKYGVGGGKRRKWRKDDFADIGMGYDESDSFIDNTDGYDEIIPKNVTAIHGGFYINSGALEFKTDEGVSSDDLSSSEDETSEKSPNRKRVLESSAASEEDTPNAAKLELPEKKQKVITPNGMQKAIKKRLFGHDKIKQIRKKRNSESKTVREILKERRIDLNMTISEFVDSPEKKDVDLPSSENKKSTVDSVDNVIESVINAVVKQKEETSEESIKNNSSKEAIVNNTSVLQITEAGNDVIVVKSPEYVQLPENLPSDILEIINSLKEQAATSTEGKVKFFSGNVNVLLLNLEKKCRYLGQQSRSKVYEHLAPFVKCRRETLIKRAKNLIALEERRKIKVLIDKLKGIVKVAMPGIMQSYEEECKAVVQKKFSAQDEANKNLRMPKRHFHWDDNTKKLMKDIVTLRKKCFLNEGKQKDSLEENLVRFLKSEVQVIWPEGWMSMNTLLKYSNLAKDSKKPIDSSKKSNSNMLPDVKDSLNSNTPNISLNSSSGLTITPVTTIVHNSSPAEVNPKPVTPSETTITRVNNDNGNPAKSSIVLPLTLPDIKSPQPEETCIKYNNSLTNELAVKDNPKVCNLIPKDENLVIKEENVQKEAIVNKEEIAVIDEIILKDESTIKKEYKEDSPSTSVTKQDTFASQSTNISIIDLTDQPELIRKPGPKSKTKYYSGYVDGSSKQKKDSSKLTEELCGSSALNKIITDSLNLDLNKTASKTTHSTNFTNTFNNSLLKNPTYDYPKPKLLTNDYNKIKLPGSDLPKAKATAVASDYSKKTISESDYNKIKISGNDLPKEQTAVVGSDYHKKIISESDYNKIKLPGNDLPAKATIAASDYSKKPILESDYNKIKLPGGDLPKAKATAVANDYSKSTILESDYNKIKLPGNDSSKAKTIASDYNKRTISESDDIQKVVEGLMVLQRMSPVKPKEETTKSSSAVPVINYNKNYSLDSRHSLPSSLTSSSNSVPHRNSSFQDAFQKQFISNFNLMKAQSIPSEGNYNSISKFNSTSHKSNSASNDSRYLQNSNHIYPQQNLTSKLKSINCSSPQTVGSYSMLDDMYTNFLNEYGHSKTANSKPTTHQK